MAFCAIATPAQAAQIGMSYADPPGEHAVEFVATPGESNNVEVDVSGGGNVVTVRDSGGTFLPGRPPLASEDCEIVNLHEARCTQTDIGFVMVDLADGVNTYRVAPGSEPFQGGVYAYGVGDQINASGMWGGAIVEGGTLANLTLGDQQGARGSVSLLGPGTGNTVNAQNGATDNVDCDNGYAKPESIKSDPQDFLGVGCPGGPAAVGPKPFPRAPIHWVPHYSPIWLP
jgi:hypothetical protein